MSDIDKMADDELEKLGVVTPKKRQQQESFYSSQDYGWPSREERFGRRPEQGSLAWPKTGDTSYRRPAVEKNSVLERLNRIRDFEWRHHGDDTAYIRPLAMDKVVVTVMGEVVKMAEAAGLTLAQRELLYLDIEAILVGHFEKLDVVYGHGRKVEVGECPGGRLEDEEVEL